jgi:hypothetical protein
MKDMTKSHEIKMNSYIEFYYQRLRILIIQLLFLRGPMYLTMDIMYLKN